MWATFKLKLPAVGKVAQLSNAAQYANTMSTLLTSGLQMTHAVDITAKVLDNYVISQGVGKMTAKLEEGKQLGECMEDVPFMPRPLVEMAVVGEETARWRRRWPPWARSTTTRPTAPRRKRSRSWSRAS